MYFAKWVSLSTHHATVLLSLVVLARQLGLQSAFKVLKLVWLCYFSSASFQFLRVFGPDFRFQEICYELAWMFYVLCTIQWTQNHNTHTHTHKKLLRQRSRQYGKSDFKIPLSLWAEFLADVFFFQGKRCPCQTFKHPSHFPGRNVNFFQRGWFFSLFCPIELRLTTTSLLQSHFFFGRIKTAEKLIFITVELKGKKVRNNVIASSLGLGLAFLVCPSSL